MTTTSDVSNEDFYKKKLRRAFAYRWNDKIIAQNEKNLAVRQLKASINRWKELLDEIENISCLEDLLTNNHEVLRELGKRLSKEF